MNSSSEHESLTLKELTIRGLILGILITLLFTAANVYFGLKAGLTFSTSIPAAVISMAILRWLKNSSIQENNIVQTVASAAGTLSAIIFVLPGLVILGFWSGFPFWMSFGICVTGGILGVMYTIPLRRALVTNSDLPYPEGVACAEVLKVGSGEEEDPDAEAVEAKSAGLKAVTVGGIVAAIFYVIVQTKVFAASLSGYFGFGSDRGAATGFDFSLSFALLAIGHLVGLSVGISMLVGAIVGWGWLVPMYSIIDPGTFVNPGSAPDVAHQTWEHYVRYIGAGAIGVAAIWALVKLVKPVMVGLAGAMAAARTRKAGKGDTLPQVERDMPIGIVTAITVLCLIPIAYLLWHFAGINGLTAAMSTLVIGGIIFVVILSFFVSAICGYMAGLIGSSNSPLSGVGILVVVLAALLLLVGVKSDLPADTGKALVAFALFITSVVFAVASIANNNLQDLKTGQLVHATPWKQQFALVIGVIAGAVVIPPVLDLLAQAYGFAGGPHATENALPSPQAGLISALARGVIQSSIDWSLIGIGGAIGAAAVILDEVLARTTKRLRMPPLGVGLGIYLPTSTTLMVVVGAIVGWWFNRKANRKSKPEALKQLGVLLASGLIVGESILGVIFAAAVAFSGSSAPIALVGENFAIPAIAIGAIVFILTVMVLYRWLFHLARD
ncbi:MAG: oligopeptide transporter, OPT family [Gammaproteobacteria bacterium]|nr:oligopeptide transporter, OPT family [Gammaproteobacteria bacterium]